MWVYPWSGARVWTTREKTHSSLVLINEHRVGPQGYLNGSYSNRGIGAVRVRATHADRDDGNENESAKEWQVRL